MKTANDAIMTQEFDMKKLLISCLIALTPLAVVAQAQEPLEALLPPLAPWKGASEKLQLRANHPLATPGEKSGLTLSPSYADTMAYVRKLAADSPLFTIEVFGKTPQGRGMIAVIARKPSQTKKPVLLVQAGIHSGEIDGKDAGLISWQGYPAR
jgi:hypothetical protein